MSLDAIKNLSPQHRAIVGGVVVLITLALMVYLVYLPKHQRISQLEGEIEALESEVSIYQVKVRKLDELIQENRRLQKLLEAQKRQLPDTFEIANLLKQVNDANSKAGTALLTWKPGAPALDPSALYQKMPVSVEISGTYHQLALLMEQIARLDRIINVNNMNIKTKKDVGLTSSFTATAFAAPPPGAQPADNTPQKKKKKRR